MYLGDDMTEIKKIINNTFQEASITLSENRLTLIARDNSKKYKSIPCYSELFEIQGRNLVKYLIETFLNNNTVLEVDYNKGIHITTLTNKLNIYISNINEFSDLIEMIETAKRESILGYLNAHKIKALELAFSLNETGLSVDNFLNPKYVRYTVLNSENEKIQMGERNLIKDLISWLDVNNIDEVNSELNYIIESKKNPLFRIKNLVFDLSNCSIENLEFIKQVINLYNKKESQLVLKMGGNYEFNDGKIG